MDFTRDLLLTYYFDFNHQMVYWERLIYIGIVLLIYFAIHMFIKDPFYKKNGFDLNFFNVKTAIIISLVLFIALPYLKKSIINRFNDFEIGIGDDLSELDFSDLYDRIYDKVNAKGELYATLSNIKDPYSGVSEMYSSLGIDTEGRITFFRLNFYAWKYGKWVLYDGYYANGTMSFQYVNHIRVPLDEVYEGESNLKDLMYELDNMNFEKILSLTDAVKEDRDYHAFYPTARYYFEFMYREYKLETHYPDVILDGFIRESFTTNQYDEEGKAYSITEIYRYENSDSIVRIEPGETWTGHINGVGLYYTLQLDADAFMTSSGILVYAAEPKDSDN